MAQNLKIIFLVIILSWWNMRGIPYKERVLLLNPVQWNIKIKILACFIVDKLEKMNNKIEKLQISYHPEVITAHFGFISFRLLFMHIYEYFMPIFYAYTC